MAKKKKQQIREVAYFAHYDAESGMIVSVNNYKDNVYTHSVNITYEQYTNLVSGFDQFTDYYIGTVINADNVAVPALVSKKPNAKKNFKSGLLEWAYEHNYEDEDITIHWNEASAKWTFSASAKTRKLNRSNSLSFNNIAFFVCLNRDPSLLIRSITVDLIALQEYDLEVPFESDNEMFIDFIGILSDNVSAKCNLKVWRRDGEN